MYRFSANSRATISSTAIFLSQQSRQYFSSPRGSDTSLAPQSAHRALTTAFRDIGIVQFTTYNSELEVVLSLSAHQGSFAMERPTHRGLRHLALNVRRLEEMTRFYVD